jgi:hypothetical protein
MIVSSRQNLHDYALRKLGFPVININVDDDQLDDRIDEAITLFQTFHVDATQKIYVAHQLTANDVNAKSFVMPANTIGVTRIFPLAGDSINSTGTQNFNIFDINYQIRLNELYDFTSADYVYYELANQHIQTLQMLFFGETPIRYNKYTNTLFMDFNWLDGSKQGTWIIAEAYQTLDPTGSLFWNDPWLKKYTTCLFKEQWGTNLKKFGNVQLPGGVVLNGKEIYDEAVLEKKELYEELRSMWESPAEWFVA